jgi:hypothetical protein
VFNEDIDYVGSQSLILLSFLTITNIPIIM